MPMLFFILVTVAPFTLAQLLFDAETGGWLGWTLLFLGPQLIVWYVFQLLVEGQANLFGAPVATAPLLGIGAGLAAVAGAQMTVDTLSGWSLLVAAIVVTSAALLAELVNNGWNH